MRVALILLIACAVASAQPDLAPLKVLVNDSPEPGFLLLAPNCRITPRPYGSFLGVYNVNGGVVRTGRVTNYPFEYKVFPDGRLGFSELVVFAGASVPAGVYIVDTLLAVQEFVSQQRGSIPQTVSQHSASRQFGFSCTTRQEPAALSPQSSVSAIACSTQPSSQRTEQQYSKPTEEQTASQIAPLLQDGVACG
jgi:hypothetical protein